MIILFAALVLFDAVRTKGRIARALNMSLFKVTLPPGSFASSTDKSPKELIGLMEQLYATFSNLHAWGWNKFLYGEPYMSLELAVPHIGETIQFYVSVPESYGHYFQKQVGGLFPALKLEPIKDYSIFNPTGAVSAAYLTLQNESILPLKTYAYLEEDPFAHFVTALSELEKEGEGAAVQILIRPSHQERVRRRAEQIARHLQFGKDSQSRLVQPSPHDNMVDALMAKASRPLFDSNVRILASAVDDVRARKLVNSVARAFVQFSDPHLNCFQATLVHSGDLDDMIFNFSFRLFDRKQTVFLSNEELSSIYHFPMRSEITV